MIVEVKTGGANREYTNRVVAYDGRTGLLIVNKPGPQTVPDAPVVQQLIAAGVLVPVTEEKPVEADVAPATDDDTNEPEPPAPAVDETEGMTPLQALKHMLLQQGHAEDDVAKVRSIKQAEALLAGEE